KTRARTRWALLAIAIVGFGSAIAVYHLTTPEVYDPNGYHPLENKKYVHDLQVYGGTANVLFAEFTEWFTGLWHGRQLATTLAVLTALTLLLVRWVRVPLPPEGDEPDEPAT